MTQFSLILKMCTRYFRHFDRVDTGLPDLKRSSLVLAARVLLCFEPGRAWEDACILLSICREGSTPAERQDQSKGQTADSMVLYSQTEVSKYSVRV